MVKDVILGPLWGRVVSVHSTAIVSHIRDSLTLADLLRPHISLQVNGVEITWVHCSSATVGGLTVSVVGRKAVGEGCNDWKGSHGISYALLL